MTANVVMPKASEQGHGHPTLHSFASPASQNYHADSKASVNCLVNRFLQASCTYLSVGFYFIQDDVAISKFASFFWDLSEEKHEQAEKLLAFQNCRGGESCPPGCQKPEQDEWGEWSCCHACRYSTNEKSMNQALLEMHQIVMRHVDPHMCDFLETHYQDEEVKLIKKLRDHVTNLKRTRAHKDDFGEYLFDCLTLGESSY
ncbi:ferritin light chain, oocyte isoform-like [Hemicordylus capensis]|uniref:ferritin light chain, oocyte isoform-like n=1 Tax=Hemicordylus capensis TaxID=884348 RepID=UPI00230435A0|nr:ferritin light chain, oocyte isoform-like [Hemicordylus capensis]